MIKRIKKGIVMNLTHLKYILEVERCGSISRASAALYMGQPNLSKVIKELENELGAAIFKRTAKGVIPTEKGKDILNCARSVVAQAEKMKELCLSDANKKAYLKVSANEAGYVSQAFACAVKKLPDEPFADIFLRRMSAADVLNSVFEYDSSIGVINVPLIQEKFLKTAACEKGMKLYELGVTRLAAVVGKNSPIGFRASVSSDELSELTELKTYGNGAEDNIPGQECVRSGDSAERLIFLNLIPEAYMKVPRLPGNIIKDFGLSQKRITGIPDEENLVSAFCIYRSDYKITDTDNLFIKELEKVFSEIKDKRT